MGKRTSTTASSKTGTNPQGSRFQKLRGHRALRRQAKQDYQRARGTAHQQMLDDARTRVRSQLKRKLRRHQQAEQTYNRQVQARDQALTRTLVRNLVEAELGSVPGIGPVLKSKIIDRVFRGRLNDLHGAYRLEGIGSRRQREISRWVCRVEGQLPQRIQEDFTGKAQIMAAYREDLAKRRCQLDAMQQRIAELQALDAQIDAVLEDLAAVTWEDFHKALSDPSCPSAAVQRYIVGVFAAWEPMPEWFQHAVSVEEA
jgi:hypothetical protein